MTTILEKLVSLIAPHRCLVCSIENNIICDSCLPGVFGMAETGCALCNLPTSTLAICANCKKRTVLEHIWISSDYTGLPAVAVKRFKFAGARAAAELLGQAVAAQLPILDSETIIAPIPTVSAHVRERGYDHALLLAKEVGRLCDLPVVRLLSREHDARQVGASKRQRFAQAATAFRAKQLEQPRPVLLIDDVITTGATLMAAAEAVMKAGATSVNAAVIAKQAASDQQM